MIVYLRKIIYMFMFLVSSPAFSDCNNFSCSNVYVDRLFPVSDINYIYVATSGNESSLNCTAKDGIYTAINTQKNNSGIIYSTLLSAMMGNKKVQIRIHEATSNCEIMYVTLDRQ